MSREKGKGHALSDVGEIIITSRPKNSMGEVASSLAFVLGGTRRRRKDNRSQNLNGVS